MELQWLVPGDHQWDIKPAANDAFRVVFPTKADLVRLRRLKPVDVEGTTMWYAWLFARYTWKAVLE
jgi:hypothetical protein